MGSCAASDSNSGSRDERNLSGHIGRELRKEREDVNRVKKILFLGSGGTGKSTVFKQLRRIHGEGFEDDDKKEFISHIYSQIINEMKLAINVYIDYNHRRQQKERKQNDDNEYDEYDELLIFDDLELTSEPLTHMESANKVINFILNKNSYTQSLDATKEIILTIKQIWNTEPIIKEIYNKRNITKLETSNAYFWDKLDEIVENKYLPSEKDIMLCRLKTTGLHEMQFTIKNDIFNIIDVGGQRSQRRKWIHCFEFVVAVIFIASLSSYDEILYEDSTVNAMVDQVELFSDICNNESLLKRSMILFLNKQDLFKQKHCVDKIPLNKCPFFEKYDKDCFDYSKGTKYVMDKFTSSNKNSGTREIFPHLTCATDKNNIEKVFADVQLIVISNALSDGGYMDFDD